MNKLFIIGVLLSSINVGAQPLIEKHLNHKILPEIKKTISQEYEDIELKVLYNRPDSELLALDKKYDPTSQHPLLNEYSGAKTYYSNNKFICAIHIAKNKKEDKFFPETLTPEEVETVVGVIAWHETAHCIQDYNMLQKREQKIRIKTESYKYEVEADMYAYTMALNKNYYNAEKLIEFFNEKRRDGMFNSNYAHATNISYPKYKAEIKNVAKLDSGHYQAIHNIFLQVEPKNSTDYLPLWKFVAQKKSESNLTLGKWEKGLLEDDQVQAKPFDMYL